MIKKKKEKEYAFVREILDFIRKISQLLNKIHIKYKGVTSRWGCCWGDEGLIRGDVSLIIN